MPGAHPLPASDGTLANLLAAWGYAFDEHQRVSLTKRDPALRSEVDRIVKYHMPELRKLAGVGATQQDLRATLDRYFERPQ
jgi:hypothetical protein